MDFDFTLNIFQSDWNIMLIGIGDQKTEFLIVEFANQRKGPKDGSSMKGQFFGARGSIFRPKFNDEFKSTILGFFYCY